MSTEGSQPAAAADERLRAEAVIGRLKEALGVSSDAALADALHTSRQNISKWKARDSIPYAEAVFVSFSKGVSLDFLLAGQGSADSRARLPSNLDPEFLQAIVQNLIAAGLIAIPEDRKPAATLEVVATSIASQYERAEKVMFELVTQRGLKAMDARSAAIVATKMLASEIARSAPDGRAARGKAKRS